MLGFITSDGYTFYPDELSKVLTCPSTGLAVQYFCMTLLIGHNATFILSDGTSYITSGIVVSIF